MENGLAKIFAKYLYDVYYTIRKTIQIKKANKHGCFASGIISINSIKKHT